MDEQNERTRNIFNPDYDRNHYLGDSQLSLTVAIDSADGYSVTDNSMVKETTNETTGMYSLARPIQERRQAHRCNRTV
jgi:hypothetical protein